MDVVLAVAAIGAVLVAAWAAREAGRSASAAADLVEIEAARDERTEVEARWHDARRVAMNADINRHDLDGEHLGIRVTVTIDNSAEAPIQKCRLLIETPDATYGPHVLGNLRRETTATIVAYLPAPSIATDGPILPLVAKMRFKDVERRAWVVDARGTIEEDEHDDDWWITRSQAWVEHAATLPEMWGAGERF